MGAKKSVFVGFNPAIWQELATKVIVPFTHALQARGYSVVIPERITGPTSLTVGLLSEHRISQCLFLARSVRWRDTVLEQQLDQAVQLKLPSFGFVYKDTGPDTVVGTHILDLFRLREIGYCNAVRSVEELVRCLDLVPHSHFPTAKRGQS